MSAAYVFSIAARDELWSGGTLIESRASHGRATCRGNEIDALSIADPELMERAEALLAPLREIARTQEARVRIVASARRINDYIRDESTLHTPPSRRLRGEGGRRPDEGLPILWKTGSASVLLHEACGHAAEHDHYSTWPAWLTIRDEPGFPIDDANEPTRIADLMREPPQTNRRKSFTDVPLKRMTTLIARQHGAPWSLPGDRIEIECVDGGAYEPLTGIVTLNIVVADLVRGDEITPLQPFRIQTHRDHIAQSIKGAQGEPLRYDGVVCSREGQELVVGSFAPLMLTEPL